MKQLFITFGFLIISLFVFSQHADHQQPEMSNNVEEKAVMHGIAILYGSILLPEYNDEGKAIGKALLPSLSLDYEFWWHHKVGFLFSNEFVLSSYEVQNKSGDFIKRESILISALGLTYSPIKHLGLYGGGGVEIDLATGSHFGIFRTGVEYAIPIRNNWASILAIAGDFRKQYTSISFEIGFAKGF